MSEMEIQNRLDLISSLAGISRQIHKFSQTMSLAAEDLSAATLKHETDFALFIENLHLKFIDISPPPFEKFKFSSPFIEPDGSPIVRFKLSYFPLSMVEALADFEAEDEDEINLIKGQRIFLMEKNSDGWVLALKLSYQKFGFVPSTYVKQVGIGLAVAKEEGFSTGTFFALIEKNEDDTYLCEDIYHHQKIIPLNDLYIL